MKRAGHLLGAVAEQENLRLAFWKAARGKGDRPVVRAFRQNLAEELRRMSEGILRVDYPVGRYHRFVIYDPKERVIHAARFSERVLHHALMNVCEPLFERWLIDDTYACRRGKGQWAAVRRAEVFAGQQPFFLKLDIRKYFDSIAHGPLAAALARKFKDAGMLAWFGRILGAYATAPGKGLPIGSLTSQHLANFYLGQLDRFVKERLRCPWYVRYMDDFVLWGSSAAELRELQRAIEAFLAAELDLRAKDSPYINRTSHGMDFLGCRVRPGYSMLNARSRKRFRHKLRCYGAALAAGRWSEEDFQRHAQPLCAFALQVRSWRFRRSVLEDFGRRPYGLEPGEPGRQLEQQREQLPVGQPEQEQPGQPEQQPGVPRRPSSGQGRMASKN